MKAVISLLLAALVGRVASADEVTDWNRIMLDAFLVSPAVASPLAQRLAAIVEASVFDAVNGIDRRYTPVHVVPAATPGASQRAAAVQAAYVSLVRMFPGQAATFGLQRTMSLAGISSGPGAESGESIQSGIDWGQTVADAIWAWRSSDGFAVVVPPFTGGLAPGQWRPTPSAPGLAPQLATTAPWAIASVSQFRPGGPPSLTSARYTADFEETEDMGSTSSPSRTADQTLYARFWNSTSPAGFWDPVATSLSAERHFTLSENARLLAAVNIGLADAIIGCWDAKYTYVFWRPITAIQLADTDGNPATIPDASWSPLIPTPPFPEYTSAHSCASGAAARILSNYFGENTSFSVSSAGMPGVVRNFSSFSAALDEVANARVFGGIHFRTACIDGQALGVAVGDYITGHALLPVHGEHLKATVLAQSKVGTTLQISLQITNTGLTAVHGVSVNRLVPKTLAGPGAISVIGPGLPFIIADIEPGGALILPVILNVPGTIRKFSLTEAASFTGDSGNMDALSLSQVVIL